MTTNKHDDGRVVVITGASSGIGRATALAFSRAGAAVVLASRSADALDEVAAECRKAGGQALVVPTDVADPQAMEALARKALGRHGRIDVWVEAAAVMVAAPFGQEPIDDVRRIIETNILGSVLGARMALRTFAVQGHGNLILVGSLLGLVANPRVPLYSMSKFAIRGLAMNLRHAVADQPHVHVSVVLPGPVDTPLFLRAANYTGKQLRAIPPAMAPERVAATVVRCARRPRRQATVGTVSRLVLVGHRLAPHVTEWAVAQYSAPALAQRSPQADTSGRLYEPPDDGVLRSDWRRGSLRRAMGGRWGRAEARYHQRRA